MDDRPRTDKRAAKTTIVGGQPPGNARELPPIPAGIEELLGLAAVEERFADLLYSDRTRALQLSGVGLSPTETGILSSVREPLLRKMIGRLTLTEADRRYFIGRAAAVLALVVGGPALAGCRDSVTPPPATTAGVRPDRPPPAPEPMPPTGIRPDRPTRRPSALEVETGIRADRPPDVPMAGVRPIRPGDPETIGGRGGIRPDRPEEHDSSRGKGGARPDRPRPDAGRPQRGVAPDWPRPDAGPPSPPRTRGISPDRPRKRSEGED